MGDGGHVPVLLEEAVNALSIRPDGVYVDATFGRGGHARRILGLLGPAGRLVALDRDPDAEIAAGAVHDPRFAFRRAWFSELPAVLADLRIETIDGAGRILVPPALRQYAALDKRVVLVGQGNKFELWDEAKWLERTEHVVVFPAGLPPELDGFSL